MSTTAEQQAGNITSPATGDVTDREWMMALATSGTAAYVDMGNYPSYFDRYIDIQADGGKIYVATSSATTAINKSTTGATPTTADGATICWAIPDGQTISIRPNKARPYLHFQADTGTPTLRVRTSSNESNSRSAVGL
jgi:hypothetical protein